MTCGDTFLRCRSTCNHEWVTFGEAMRPEGVVSVDFATEWVIQDAVETTAMHGASAQWFLCQRRRNDDRFGAAGTPDFVACQFRCGPEVLTARGTRERDRCLLRGAGGRTGTAPISPHQEPRRNRGEQQDDEQRRRQPDFRHVQTRGFDQVAGADFQIQERASTAVGLLLLLAMKRTMGISSEPNSTWSSS